MIQNGFLGGDSELNSKREENFDGVDTIVKKTKLMSEKGADVKLY